MPTDRARRGHARRGQALVELALGMFALALVVSALCTFAVYIARSLRHQNTLRADMGSNGGARSASDAIDVDDFAADWIVGSASLDISERVEFPRR